MPWFLSDCEWIFSCWGKAFVRPKDSPPFPLFFFVCSSFSLRWDEFGQNRRGSESTAAPRRGPRVSFTENLKQQQRNFRELKQRVFGHWLGRYTARVLVATRFLLWVKQKCLLEKPPEENFTTSCQLHPGSITLGKWGFVWAELSAPLLAHTHCTHGLFPCVRMAKTASTVTHLHHWVCPLLLHDAKERWKRFGVCYTPSGARCVGWTVGSTPSSVRGKCARQPGPLSVNALEGTLNSGAFFQGLCASNSQSRLFLIFIRLFLWSQSAFHRRKTQ